LYPWDRLRPILKEAMNSIHPLPRTAAISVLEVHRSRGRRPLLSLTLAGLVLRMDE